MSLFQYARHAIGGAAIAVSFPPYFGMSADFALLVAGPGAILSVLALAAFSEALD